MKIIRKKVCVIISGSGSNLQALIDHCASEQSSAEIALVISNKPGVFGLERAARAGIPARVIEHNAYESREAFEDALDNALQEETIELICLAGFLRILTADFVEKWLGRILNIHPSLLPAFPGLHVHEQALAEGVRLSGCAVHFVDAGLDCGPIIIQAAVPVVPGDDADRLAARILQSEHAIYPRALEWVASGRARLVNGRCEFDNPGHVPDALIWPA
ncbi:MAG: phosphoribosylglycinamide formyltransferase [Pseudomonadota bacterium]